MWRKGKQECADRRRNLYTDKTMEQAIQLHSLVDQKLQQAMGTMEIKQGAGSNIGEHIDKMARVSEAVKCCAAQLLFAHWKEA